MKSSNYLGLLALILVMCATTACSDAEPEVVTEDVTEAPVEEVVEATETVEKATEAVEKATEAVEKATEAVEKAVEEATEAIEKAVEEAAPEAGPAGEVPPDDE
jgi:phage shock protein A